MELALLAQIVTSGGGGGGGSLPALDTGDLLVGSGVNTLTTIPDVAIGNALISGGVGAAPSYGKIGLTTHVTGTLAVPNGGTGATAFTAGDVLFGNGAGALAHNSNFNWLNASNQLTIQGNNGVSTLRAYGVSDGSTGTYGPISWYAQPTSVLVGLLSLADNNEGQFYLLGDSTIQSNCGEFAVLDRSIGGDKRVAGFQCLFSGGEYQTYLYAKGIYGIKLTSSGSVIVFPGNKFAINDDPTGHDTLAVFTNNSYDHIFEINGGDDSTTPTNPATPVGYIHIQVDGNDSWFPYFQ